MILSPGRRNPFGRDAEKGAPGAGQARENGAPASWEHDWDLPTAKMLRELFRQEALEHIEAVTTIALTLNRDLRQIPEALRRAHALKGSAATVGLFDVQRAAHLLEEELVRVQQRGAPCEESAVDRP